MNREQITEALKMLKSYEVAVREYEESRLITEEGKYSAAPCRVAVYSDMPMGTGSGSRAPKITGLWSMEDSLEYQRCLYMSRWLRAALETLYEDERKVITLKYMDGMTLKQIAQRIHVSSGKSKSLHKVGMEKLDTCLQFVDYVHKSAIAA